MSRSRARRIAVQDSLAAQVRQVNRELLAELRAQSGADSEPVMKAAGVLRGRWREVLGVRSRASSAPGQPPHARSAQLRRSIRTAVVDGVRRVGSGWFVSRLMEFGVFAQYAPKVRGSARVKLSKGREWRRGASVMISIAPRPHARIALELAQADMVDVTVEALQRRIAGGT